MRKLFVLVLVFMMALSGSALAAKRAAGVYADDYGCKGIMLDSVPNTEQLEKAFGKILFDRDVSVFGLKVKYYFFKHGIEVGVNSSGKVVDIVVKDEEYQARDGVRYGSTPAKIIRVFGKTDRHFIGGRIWYIFERQEEKYHRLMIEMDTEKNVLESFRITLLPLTDEEADERAMQDEEWESNDLNAVMMRKKDIDMSAVIKNEVTVKGRFTR